ncbi:hypothetical protein FPV67DRAFT_302071 [Lyophyllum atratum]|nr:hypothetical protein FPV67DRAFT_302071 [Lyophyllum atratum]
MFSSKAIGRLLNSSRNGRWLAKPHLCAARNTNWVCHSVRLLNVNREYCNLYPQLNLKTFRVIQHTTPRRSFMASSCSYRTRTLPPDEAEAKEADSKAESEQWISILENTVSAPWLFSLPPDPEQRLKLAYALLFQIVLYLTRPAEAEQFIVAFGTAPASSDSEIGRARASVGVIIKAAVHQMSSVPANSPVRSDQADVFDIFGALHAIHDMYLTDSDISDLETWSDFWMRAQPVVLELGMKLDEKGFGVTEDDWNEMKESERKEEKASEMKSE